MKAVEETGRSVEEALQVALEKLEVGRDDVEVHVLEEPSRGFMGFLGGRPARIKVVVKKTALDRAQEFLTEVTNALDIDVQIQSAEDEGNIQIDIEGTNVGVLIGRRGQALDAWQYLTNLAANKGADQMQRVLVDVAGYRNRRTQTLTNLAKRTAERVKSRRRQIALEPMSAAERRIIHLTLQDDSEVETISEGREPFRRVIIDTKKRWQSE